MKFIFEILPNATMPHTVHITLESSLSPGSLVESTQIITLLSPTPLTLLLRVYLRTQNFDAPLDPNPESGSCMKCTTQDTDRMGLVNDPGDRFITIALHSFQNTPATPQDPQPRHPYDLAPLATSPPPLAIPWWMALLSLPMPPLHAFGVRPEFSAPKQDHPAVTLSYLPFYYYDLLQGFSYFVGGGYTQPSE